MNWPIISDGPDWLLTPNKTLQLRRIFINVISCKFVLIVVTCHIFTFNIYFLLIALRAARALMMVFMKFNYFLRWKQITSIMIVINNSCETSAFALPCRVVFSSQFICRLRWDNSRLELEPSEGILKARL